MRASPLRSRTAARTRICGLRDLDGGGERRFTRTNGLSSFSWTPDGGVIFAQFELADRYRVYSDLYRAGADGRVTRVTRGGRLASPDVHPDGDRAVAVQEGDGTNRLVLVELATGEVSPLAEADPAVHWAFPRWSPDGARIAVSQWRTGGRFDVVILDAGGGLVARVTDDRAVDASPAWSPDGRTLLWSSDRTGIPNLFAVAIDGDGRPGTVRQVTNLLTGAAHPSIDPAGEWIYYSAYHHDGWDIERIPYDPGEWFEPFAGDPRFLVGADRSPDRFEAAIEAESRPYRAFRSLLPTYWQPLYAPPRRIRERDVIGRAFGFSTSGRDLVDRHSFWTWGRLIPDKRRGEGRFGYTTAALGNPVVTLSAGQLYDPAGLTLGERENGDVDTLYVVDRERRVQLSVDLQRARFRNRIGLTLEASHNWVSSELLDATLEPSTTFRLNRPTRRVGELAATLGFTTARAHTMSMTRADGVSGVVRGRVARVLDLPDELAGNPSADHGFEEVTGRLSLYRALGNVGFAQQVFAPARERRRCARARRRRLSFRGGEMPPARASGSPASPSSEARPSSFRCAATPPRPAGDASPGRRRPNTGCRSRSFAGVSGPGPCTSTGPAQACSPMRATPGARRARPSPPGARNGLPSPPSDSR